MLLPSQTSVPGTQSATQAAALPAVWQRPMAQGAAVLHLPVARQVSVAVSPTPPSSSVQRIVPGAQSAPQILARAPAAVV